MSDILAVYAWVDPATGYCQGLCSSLLICFLFNMKCKTSRYDKIKFRFTFKFQWQVWATYYRLLSFFMKIMLMLFGASKCYCVDWYSFFSRLLYIVPCKSNLVLIYFSIYPARKFSHGRTNWSNEAIAGSVEDLGADWYWDLYTFIVNWCGEPSLCFPNAFGAISARIVFQWGSWHVGG